MQYFTSCLCSIVPWWYTSTPGKTKKVTCYQDKKHDLLQSELLQPIESKKQYSKDKRADRKKKKVQMGTRDIVSPFLRARSLHVRDQSSRTTINVTQHYKVWKV